MKRSGAPRARQLQLGEVDPPALGDLLEVGSVACVREAAADAVGADLAGRDDERRDVALLAEEVATAEEPRPEGRCLRGRGQVGPDQAVLHEDHVEVRPTVGLVEEPGGVAPHEERTRRVRVGPALLDLLAPRGQPGVVEEAAEVLVPLAGHPRQLQSERESRLYDVPPSIFEVCLRHDLWISCLSAHLCLPLSFVCCVQI